MTYLARWGFAGTVAYMGGVPTLPEPFVWSWSQMLVFNGERLPFPVHYDRATMSHHSTARNQLAARFVGDWLIMLDTDHWFEPDLVWRILDRASRYNLDVLSGLYRYKSWPHSPVAYCWGDKSKGQRTLIKIGAWPEDSPLFQVDAAGGGCLFVRRTVFDRIREELQEEPFDSTKDLQGEDIAFFDRLRRLGIPAWLDTRIKAQHLNWHAVGDADFDNDLIDDSAEERQMGAIEMTPTV